MCSYVAVAMGAQGAATLLKGAAAKAHGDAARDADYLSAGLSQRAAGDAVERGKLKDLQVALHTDAVVAEQRVIQSGTGADINIGGHKDTQDATEAVGAVDRKIVQYNAEMEAYGLKQRARAQYQRGANAEAEGKAAMLGTFLGGIGHLGAEGAMMSADEETA